MAIDTLQLSRDLDFSRDQADTLAQIFLRYSNEELERKIREEFARIKQRLVALQSSQQELKSSQRELQSSQKELNSSQQDLQSSQQEMKSLVDPRRPGGLRSACGLRRSVAMSCRAAISLVRVPFAQRSAGLLRARLLLSRP